MLREIKLIWMYLRFLISIINLQYYVLPQTGMASDCSRCGQLFRTVFWEYVNNDETSMNK